MVRGEFSKHYRIKTIRDVARRLRRKQTDSEAILWQALRNRRLSGLKFLRQHPVGPTVLDFYCHEKHIAIEVDGGIHQARSIKERDSNRQELIEKYGIRFFRCKAEEVEHDLEGVLARLRQALTL